MTNLVEAVGCFVFLMVYKLRIWDAIKMCVKRLNFHYEGGIMIGRWKCPIYMNNHN